MIAVRKLPARYAPIVMPFVLSILMTAVVSVISTLRSLGATPAFLATWPGAWALSWLVAFPTLLMVLENRDSPSLAILRSRTAEFFARISYALYLVHINVLIMVFWIFRSQPTIGTMKGVALTAYDGGLIRLSAPPEGWQEQDTQRLRTALGRCA